MNTPSDKNNPIPVPGQETGSAPAAVPVCPVIESEPRVKHFDPKKSFTGTNTIDKLKEYAKEAPKVRAHFLNTIDKAEAALREFKAALQEFNHVVVMSKSMLDRLEAEEKEKKKSGGSSKSE